MLEVEALKAVVKKSGGNPSPYQVDLMLHQQWQHINDILEVKKNFNEEGWIDPDKMIPKPHRRTDKRLKNYPYRNKLIGSPR